MSAAAHPQKVSGIEPSISPPTHNFGRAVGAPQTGPEIHLLSPVGDATALHDRLASWVSDLTTLQELTEQQTRTGTLDAALAELLSAGASLVGARRGLVILEPSDGLGPNTTAGYGLRRADLGVIETAPRGAADGISEVLHADLAHEPDLDPRHREIAAQLGFSASYAVRLATERTGRLGCAVWLYDEPAQPSERRRHLLGLYTRCAAEHIAGQIELLRARSGLEQLREGLLPSRLPRVRGVRLAVRHRLGRHGGGSWYDALPLPEGALGLAVGSATGSGPCAIAAMGRLRAALRAYAVMEGEDPVAVLSDLELLLRMTEPAHSATALFAYVQPADRRLLLAGAGHCPPLVVRDQGTAYVETSLSAPLGMVSYWEAPSAEVELAPGDTLLVFTDGLLHGTGLPVDRAFTLLHTAALGAPRAVREDPELLVDHVLHRCLPDGGQQCAEDVVLLAARFHG